MKACAGIELFQYYAHCSVIEPFPDLVLCKTIFCFSASLAPLVVPIPGGAERTGEEE